MPKNKDRPPIRCYNCGYEWVTRRLSPPARCPACQSRKWYVPARKPEPTLPMAPQPEGVEQP